MYIKFWLRKCSKKKDLRKLEEYAKNNIDALQSAFIKVYPDMSECSIHINSLSTKIEIMNNYNIIKCKPKFTAYGDFGGWVFERHAKLLFLCAIFDQYIGYKHIIFSEVSCGNRIYGGTINKHILATYCKNKKILAIQNTMLKELDATTKI